MIDIDHRMEKLTVQQMMAFCLVYESGSYANAAQSRDQAGTTVWEQVKALEKSYGKPLFERIGRNIQPTANGRALYELLTPLLANIESSFELLDQADGSLPTFLRIASGNRLILEDLGPPLRTFRKQFEQVTLRILAADNQLAQALVLEGKVDLGLMIEPPAMFLHQGLEYRQLYTIEYLAVLPPRHALTKRKSIEFKQLLDYPLVVGHEGTIGRSMFEQACFRLRIRKPLRIAAETDNSATTLACVRAGLGIGIIAGSMRGYLTKGLPCRSLTKEMGQVQIVAAYRAGRQLSSPALEFLELLGRSQEL